MSHTRALNFFAKNSEVSYGIVFEDDAVLEKNLARSMMNGEFNSSSILEVLQKLARTAKNHKWHGLNLGRCFDDCPSRVVESYVKAGMDVVKTCNSFCTHAYIITKRGAEILKQYTLPIMGTADGIRCALSQQNRFQYFSVTPRLFSQDREGQVGLHSSDEMSECVRHDEVQCMVRQPWINDMIKKYPKH